jgi:alkanesulfonate monooxygenase SsuD/methylene tetrahydromethanopterin reductase-like flavin-dependent oxidoreductase (luciferase family)
MPYLTRAAAEGFNLAYAVMPETFADFVDLVVPELQTGRSHSLCGK